MTNIHGTAVVIDDKAVLIRGISGSGKSDLALRLIDRGAKLLADDQVIAEVSGSDVYLTSPKSTSGLLEIRGLGIIHFDHICKAPLALVVDLLADFEAERLPEPCFEKIKDIKFPQLKLEAKRESLHIIVEHAMAKLCGNRVVKHNKETWGL